MIYDVDLNDADSRTNKSIPRFQTQMDDLVWFEEDGYKTGSFVKLLCY